MVMFRSIPCLSSFESGQHAARLSLSGLGQGIPPDSSTTASRGFPEPISSYFLSTAKLGMKEGK